ncbi:MAG: 50S ribosomal protein L11 methyltransferase [Chloracidobacterium sp.]|uniref:Ribosomal protein L11 methyltransferase n=1 Tax=Chloracidobacterium validum TaxID=2821543 RepID=A0ABX8B9W7_9BACT|nr:50S ribosomal protein L11 methyltransferase [Chloracidobacterium validum]QUW03678.1 50S ribosomal protein L11 methyltransferase [Chloracidobacterium validum]
MHFHTAQVTIPRNTADAVSEAFWQLGAQGIETLAETDAVTTLRAYFPVAPARATIQAVLERTLSAFDYSTAQSLNLTIEQHPHEDWLAKWKADWQAQPIGRHWLIVPPWRQAEAQARSDSTERIFIEIEPGMAFGTGTHPTTRACLELLESLPTSPKVILDVGTGTGILAMAAAKLFPQARCYACDTDSDAIAIATDNARRNGVDGRIHFLVGSVTAYPDSDVDILLANLTAEVVTDLATEFARVLCPGGRLIVAGVLTDRHFAVGAALRAAGMEVLTTQTDGEWWAALAQRRPIPPAPGTDHHQSTPA